MKSIEFGFRIGLYDIDDDLNVKGISTYIRFGIRLELNPLHWGLFKQANTVSLSLPFCYLAADFK